MGVVWYLGAWSPKNFIDTELPHFAKSSDGPVVLSLIAVIQHEGTTSKSDPE